MKQTSLVALVAVAVFIGVLLYSFADNMSVYTDFQSARLQPQGNEVHVVASWVRREEAHYDPATDRFDFYLQDSLGNTQLVRYFDPKPANFEQAEKVVVIGRYQQDAFVADKILMKCPSKYEGKELGTPAYYPSDSARKQIRG